MTEAASERYKSFMRVYEQQIGCPGCGNALMKLGFFEAPASKKFQGAYPGGLFDHSVLVTEFTGTRHIRPYALVCCMIYVRPTNIY